MRTTHRLFNRFIEMAKAASIDSSTTSGRVDSVCVVKTHGSDSSSSASREDKENQEAYNFLHRSAHRHSDLGGYGEDFGFHYPPRAFVDPDSPHVYPYYNRWHQCANLRESRYSHHRRMLQSLDIPKLVRHGRLLPLPHKLLNDYLMSKIPLRDSDCAAFFDYAHSILIKTASSSSNGADQESYFTHIVDMFERLLATKLPPSDVGPKTHAGVIRCCAQLQKFTEGYQWFRQRATSIQMKHTPELYDSIVELCEKCDEKAHAWQEFENMLKDMREIPPITLCRMLRIAANEGNYEMGRDVWELFNFYGHKKNGKIYEAGLEWISECQGKGREALHMMTEMKHLMNTSEQPASSSSSSLSVVGTYDRFSSKIIQNNQSVYSSGISLYNPENQTYSNNQSIAEYEASAFMKSLQPTALTILSTLYCLICTDKEAFQLAWNVFCEHFSDNGIRDSSAGNNTLLKSMPPETITYMFYGASLHTDVRVSLKLYEAVKSSPVFSRNGVLVPQAMYYRIQTFRKYFERARENEILPHSFSSRKSPRHLSVECFESIASSHRLKNLLEKSGKHYKSNLPGESSENEGLGQVFIKEFAAIVYDVPIATHGSIQEGKRCSVVSDVSNFLESPFHFCTPKAHQDTTTCPSESISSEKEIFDVFSLGFPEQIEKDIQVTEGRFPGSVHEEWIYTEYIGALSAFSWSLKLDSHEHHLSYTTGFRKALSAAKNLTSKNYSLNTRVLYYLLRLLKRYSVELRTVFGRHSSPDVSLSLLDAHSDVIYNRLDEVLHIIESHRSAVHFMSCDKIRHEVYRIQDFFEWLSLQQRVHQKKFTYATLIERQWQRMATKSDIIFQRDPSFVISKVHSTSHPHGDIDKIDIFSENVSSNTHLKKLSRQWETYQKNLWGSDPEAPPAPRRAEKVTRFHFSREDKALCKFGQRLASPKTQSSF